MQKNALLFAMVALSAAVIASLGAFANPALFLDDLSASRPSAEMPPRAKCAGSVTMYSLSGCAACTWQRNQLQQHNIPFTERVVDQNPAHRAHLVKKAKSVGLDNYGYPVVEIGDVLLINPYIDDIKRHLCQRGH